MSKPRDIYSGELIRLAERLVSGAERGRPRTIDLRRGISSAYYGVFHRICRDAAIALLGSATSREAHRLVRHINHGDLRKLSTDVTSSRPTKVLEVLGKPSADLIQVGRSFIELQDARHSADYDHEYGVSRKLAAAFVEQAWEAHGRAEQMRTTGDRSYRVFCGLALGGVKIINQR